jgi:hypothetical protein
MAAAAAAPAVAPKEKKRKKKRRRQSRHYRPLRHACPSYGDASSVARAVALFPFALEEI